MAKTPTLPRERNPNKVRSDLVRGLRLLGDARRAYHANPHRGTWARFVDRHMAVTALIARVRDKYRELCPIPCTQCKYCLPCPSGVNIPGVLEIYNEAIMYNDHNRAQALYNWLKEEERADSCTQCAQCEELCPQEIEIVEWLAHIHQLLDESQNQ